MPILCILFNCVAEASISYIFRIFNKLLIPESMNFSMCQTAFLHKNIARQRVAIGLVSLERWGTIRLRKQMPTKAIIYRLQFYNGNYFPSEQPKLRMYLKMTLLL